MRFIQGVAASAAIWSSVTLGQTTTTSSSLSLATPPSGNYSGALRPQVHFSPPKGFMNDPNGMHKDAKGIWHLYYQYNPTDTVAGNQHWGHATSKDLYTWINQPIALAPEAEGEGIFSGSAVIDVNNTSGFFPNQTNGVVAIYTLNTPDRETQDIAYSFDDGFSFIKYAKNPVIDIGSTQFRDPKVIWYAPTQQWVMVVAYAQEFVIGVFTSPNLTHWEHASNFSHWGLLGLQYECPNLVSMPMEGSDDPVWVLAISINPGAPLGGSIMQYFPGSFNGTHFEPFDNAARISDFGKDNYAAQWFYEDGEDGSQAPVHMAWASNWEYTNDVPTGPLEGWRSSMTIPRRTYLKNTTRIGYNMIEEPYNLKSIYDEVLVNKTGGNGTYSLDYADVSSGALYLRVNISGIPTNSSISGTVNMTLSSSATNQTFQGGLFLPDSFWLNRGKSGSYDNVFFTNAFSTALPFDTKGDGVVLIEAIIDRSLLEVFLNGGERSATSLFFPDEKMDRLVVSAMGLNQGVSVEVLVRGLRSGWEGQEVEGIVYGNVTRVET